MYATVTERFASTATLPAWARAGFDEQEQGNEILVKNTPGGFKTSAIPQRLLDPILAYLGLQFQTTNEFFSRSALSNDAMGRFLINNVTGAHSHVDMCIYMIHGQLSPVDIQFMKQLSEFVNLVPVLIPAEATPPSQVMLDRLELMRQLCHHGIEIYGMDTDELLQDSRGVSSDSETSDRPMLPLGAFRASDPLTSIPMAPYLSPPFVFYLSSTLSSSSSSSFPENLTNPATTSHSWQDVAEDKSSPLGTSQYEQQATLPPSLAAAATAHPRSLQQPATADQSLLHLWNNQQMHVMRDWMLTTNLEALRYQTTLKFLAWRRQLPWMTLSDSLYSQQESSGHESMPSVADGDGVSGASSANGAPDSAYDHHHHHPLRPHRPGTHSHLLPSEHLAALQARNKERVTKAMLRILESESVVLRRILDERREAWRQALEQMEREERVEFLVQELKTWAREGGEQRYGDGVAHTAPAGSSGGGPVPEATTGGLRPVADFCRKTTNDAEGFVTRGGGSDTIVRSNLYQVSSDNPSDRGRFSGMGLEKGNHSTGSLRQQHQHQRSSVEICRAPTTVAGARTKQPLPSLSSGKPWFLSGSKVSSTPSTATTGSSRTRSRTRRSRARSRENESALWDSRPVLSLKASPRTSSVSSKPRDDGKDGEAEEDEDAENSRSDPLGLGSIVGRLFSALGRGVLNVAVVVTMTGLAQWVYSNFLEHMRVEWIL
ncbi:septin 2 [Actinomortierella ambigua]|nr:septin 2 [Actinomortierella ambigua]